MKAATWLAIAAVGLLSPRAANNYIAFVADRYYFELSYGQGREFFEESHLPGSSIWKLHFRSILRIELPSTGPGYRGFALPADAQRTRLAWNPSGTLGTATFGEYVFVLTPQFQIHTVYRNTNDPRWLNDDELQATVEVGGPVSKYETAEFGINVRTGAVRKLP